MLFIPVLKMNLKFLFSVIMETHVDMVCLKLNISDLFVDQQNVDGQI